MFTRQLSFLMGARNEADQSHKYAKGFDLGFHNEVTLMA